MKRRRKTEDENELKPSVRIDGGRRTKLTNKQGVMVPARQYPQRDPKKERDRADRVIRELRNSDGGKAGAKVSIVKIRDVQGERVRTLTQAIRSKPGTFEWRYGRDKQGALFHAGSHFARLWERAGIAVASSADFLRGTGSGYATDISDARTEAVQTVAKATLVIGRASSERLIAYCVEGLTTSQLARAYDVPDRDMAAVLHQDLRAMGKHFGFV